jgi:hypothetical protein
VADDSATPSVSSLGRKDGRLLGVQSWDGHFCLGSIPVGHEAGLGGHERLENAAATSGSAQGRPRHYQPPTPHARALHHDRHWLEPGHGQRADHSKGPRVLNAVVITKQSLFGSSDTAPSTLSEHKSQMHLSFIFRGIFAWLVGAVWIQKHVL